MLSHPGRLFLCLTLASCAFATTPPAFGPLSALPAQKASLAIATADFDGDGVLDLAVSNAAVSTISIFLGTGGGKFSALPVTNQTLGCQAAYLATGKFTGAAGPDLLAVCPVGGLFVLPNKGAGTFGGPLFTALPGPAWVGNLLLGSIYPAVADLNGDGILDIAIQTFDSDSGTAGWFLLAGKSNGTFKAPSPLPFSGLLPLSIAAGDFNGDGNIDLVSTGYDESGNVFLALSAGNGQGAFGVPTLVTLPQTGTIGSLVVAGDINGDGYPDVMLAGSALLANLLTVAEGGSPASSIMVFLGDGKGGLKLTFTSPEVACMSGVARPAFSAPASSTWWKPSFKETFSAVEYPPVQLRCAPTTATAHSQVP